MNLAAIQRHPLFTLVLVASAAAVVAQGWLLAGAMGEARRAENLLAQRRQERDWLAAQSPALSAANAAALEEDVAAAEKNLAALRTALAGRRRARPEPPARPLDAYFALAAYTDRMRALAARQQVRVRADEAFGFASHTNEGPEPDLLARVHLQAVVLEHLVATLLEARPRALLGVQRERPVPESRRTVRLAPAAAAETAEPPARPGGVPADFFSPDEQLRLRRPGLVDTEAFRLEFTGQTQTLRAFLNEVAAFQLPVIVRSVEVEPALADDAPVSDAAPSPDAPVPVVRDNFSKFAVVLEFVEVLPAAPPPASP